MEFRILGPLEVTDRSRPIVIAGRRQRALLALLLLRTNQVLASDQILDALWGEQASLSSQNALQAAVSRLRRALPAERLVTRPPGYLLRVEPGELDAEQFERRRADGRAALAGDDAPAAAELLRAALSFWRGPALADFMYEPFAQTEIARLEELRLDALEERIDADLALGRHAELVAELEALVADHPLRERPRGQLMLALYRTGRQADALEVYRATRTLLLDELGLEPGPELRDLERRILAQEPALGAPTTPRPAARPVTPAPVVAQETRRTVTVLFCDLADSTGLTERLDPEVLRGVLGRYAGAASEAVAAHGGTMEKFIGDAVMAVFGVPQLHEDDALRAIRAAVEMRDRLTELSGDTGLELRARIGVETGEVVSGDASPGEALVTGPAVTTAARLEQQASPGEILLGEATLRLVSNAVRAEPRGELALKGKRESVSAWRLLELIPEAPPFARQLETPLVGRDVELAQLRQTLARAVRERSPHLFTIFGPAGIGKTRLAGELVAAADEATVLVGRCLSYGEGITFWPLREIVRQAPEGELRTRLSTLLGIEGSEEAASVPGTGEEIFLAARRLLEALAREKPLVVLLEDLHWADPTFLDLVEHVAGRAADAPMLLLCLARGELLELRETWGGGMENAAALRLEPLAEEETDVLLDALRASAGSRVQVKAVAEGNPLFVEQMLAWLEEVGDDERERGLPPTMQALLAARLDRLGPGEAAILHRAAVIGRDFESDSLHGLLPAEAQTTTSRHLDALIRKGLVKPLARGPDEGGRFRFAHALVQDAAYRMVPKRLRAELHERFASWLEHAVGDRVSEYDEILGYHLEQAYLYRAELGPRGDAERELAARAGAILTRAGLNARQRGDDAGAANLLSRGLELLPADTAGRGELLLALAHSFTNVGEPRAAYVVFEDILAAAEAAGERGLALEATLNRSALELWLWPEKRAVEEYAREAQQAIAELAGLGHERAVARAWLLIAGLRSGRGQHAAAAQAAERGAAAARRAGDRHLERFNVSWLGLTLRDGPTAASEALRRCEEICDRTDFPRIRQIMSGYLSALRAMLGHEDEARRLHELGLADAEELGNKRRIAVIEQLSRSFAATLDPAEAERKLRRSFALWEEMSNNSSRSTVSATLAHVLCTQGRNEEAERYAMIAESLGGPDDYQTHGLARAAHARVLAQREELGRAESFAREAVGIADRTDDIDMRAWLRTDLAEVLAIADKAREACSVLKDAVDLATEKEDLILVEFARARLAELQTSSPHR